LNVKKLTVFVATIFTLTFTTSSVTPNASSEPAIPLKPTAVSQPVRTIVLDPGHGGKDAGARGLRANEKDIVLEVALKLGKKVERGPAGGSVIDTRKSDVFIPLCGRPAVANNNKADLFVAIHCNAAATRRSPARGTETLVCGYSRLGQQDAAIRENASI